MRAAQISQSTLWPVEPPFSVHMLDGDLDSGRIATLFAPDATASAIAIGDARRVLATIPADVFQTCVTSPPYWSLRDYAIDGQIG